MIAALADRFKWAPGFWREMGWRELRMWLRELRRIGERAQGRERATPGSWEGADQDAVWAELRRKRDEMRA